MSVSPAVDGVFTCGVLLQYLTRERTTPEVATAIDAAVYANMVAAVEDLFDWAYADVNTELEQAWAGTPAASRRCKHPDVKRCRGVPPRRNARRGTSAKAAF